MSNSSLIFLYDPYWLRIPFFSAEFSNRGLVPFLTADLKTKKNTWKKWKISNQIEPKRLRLWFFSPKRLIKQMFQLFQLLIFCFWYNTIKHDPTNGCDSGVKKKCSLKNLFKSVLFCLKKNFQNLLEFLEFLISKFIFATFIS